MNIFWGMKILWIFFWGHRKIGLYLWVISMHSRVFSGLLKFQKKIGVLEIPDIFLW